MDRVSQVLSDTCTGKVSGLKSLSTTKKFKQLSFRHTLKYSILYDHAIRVDIESPTSFSIYEGDALVPTSEGPAIAEARLTDFLLGGARVKAHYNDLIKLKTNRANVVWLLVTAYYCSFFSAVEILKLHDRIPISLDTEDLAILRYRANGPSHAQFFQNSPVNFSGRMKAGKIVFDSSGEKPHGAVWGAMTSVLRTAFAKYDWPEVKKYLELVDSPSRNPSHIRNKWNYKRADYFGSEGERLGQEFRKIVCNHAAASGWISRANLDSDQSEACSIAALCELSATAIIQAFERVR